MEERPEVRCRLHGGPTAGAGASKFTLVPVVPATGGRTIPLLDGDNIIDMDSPSQGVKAGSDVSDQDRKSQVCLMFETGVFKLQQARLFSLSLSYPVCRSTPTV